MDVDDQERLCAEYFLTRFVIDVFGGLRYIVPGQFNERVERFERRCWPLRFPKSGPPFVLVSPGLKRSDLANSENAMSAAQFEGFEEFVRLGIWDESRFARLERQELAAAIEAANAKFLQKS